MSSAPGYEFSKEENTVIADLASKLGIVGGFMVALGFLYGLAVAVSSLPLRPPTAGEVEFNTSALLIPLIFVITFGTGAFIFMFTGFAMRRGAARFELIVSSEGNDIDHLMEALDELTKVYKVWAILMATGMVLMIMSLFVGASP